MTVLLDSVVDIEGLVRVWLNSLTGAGGLVGAGNPVGGGVHLRRMRSPFKSCFVLLASVGTPGPLTEERTTGQARLTASIYGLTKESAALAAAAYVNRMQRITVEHPSVTSGGVSVKLETVDAISGPLYLPDGDEERYLVDLDIWVQRLA